MEDRRCIDAAVRKAEATGAPAAAIELPDGQIVTGKTSPLLGASAAVLLNALKTLAGIPDDVHLISPTVIEPVQKLKVECLGNHNPRLHMDEILVALSVCAVSDENAAAAMAKIHDLTGCEAHASVILAPADEGIFRKLGIRLTCEPQYQTKRLYHG